MQLSNNQQVFLALVRAGLWEKEVQLASFGQIDFNEVYRLAKEQSVVGLVAAGLEHVVDLKAPQAIVLKFVGQTLQLEQNNMAMNDFVARLIEKLRKDDVYALLLKGQGVAQCYERPLWRSYGDVDLLLSEDNYEKAKQFLIPLATSVEIEGIEEKHLGMSIDSWEVELHGTMHSNCLAKMDKEIDAVQSDIFYCGFVRSWMNGNTQVFMPRADEDVFLVFTHILQHFFHRGIGLRQICDWCRLLGTNKDRLNIPLLEKRLKRAGILTEWKSFAFLAVNQLGMPEASMPLYSKESKWARKAMRVMEIVIEDGNFGHNKVLVDNRRGSWLIRKVRAFQRYTKDFIRQFPIFPLDSIRVWLWVMKVGTTVKN